MKRGWGSHPWSSRASPRSQEILLSPPACAGVRRVRPRGESSSVRAASRQSSSQRLMGSSRRTSTAARSPRRSPASSTATAPISRGRSDSLLARATRSLATPSPTLVVPVPLHPVRRPRSDSVQSIRRCSRGTSRPISASASGRSPSDGLRDTPRQATLDRAERGTNVGGAFRARSGHRGRGASRAPRRRCHDDRPPRSTRAVFAAEDGGTAIEVRPAVVARAERT